MKKYFVTGLVTLLPVAVTLAFVAFVFNLLTGPFVGVVSEVLESLGIGDSGLFFLSAKQTTKILSQILILIVIVGFTTLLGFLARWYFLHSLIGVGETILHRIPIISSVYKACKDVVNTVLTADTGAFKQVVICPYPNPDTRALGLVTQDQIPAVRADVEEKVIAVFVPTTPNPTSGFLILYRQEDLVYLDMRVEDAFKYIISCGVITSPFTPVPPPSPGNPAPLSAIMEEDTKS